MKFIIGLPSVQGTTIFEGKKPPFSGYSETPQSHFYTCKDILCKTAWRDVVFDVESLSICLQSYSSVIDKYNDQQKHTRQVQPYPVRPLGTYSSVQHSPSGEGDVKPCYSMINQVVTESEAYMPVYFDDTIHVDKPWTNRMQRVHFIEVLCLSHPIDILTYDPGTGLVKTVFVESPREPVSNTQFLSCQIAISLCRTL